MFKRSHGVNRMLGILLWSLVGMNSLGAQGEVSFIARRDFGVGSAPGSVTVSDFNGDAVPDLAVSNSYSGNVSILLGNGDGTFQAAKNFSVGSTPNAVVVGDFNSDAMPDLAVTNYTSNRVTLLLGVGDGTFRQGQSFAVGSGPGALTVGDFNGDTFADLAVANSGSPMAATTVSLLLGHGDGTFQPVQTLARIIHGFCAGY